MRGSGNISVSAFMSFVNGIVFNLTAVLPGGNTAYENALTREYIGAWRRKKEKAELAA